MKTALVVALDALRYFGLSLPESDDDIRAAIEIQFREIPVNLGGRAIGELIDAPVAVDPAMRAIIDLLVDAAPCAYIGRPALFPLISLEAVNRSMRYGNTEQSSFVYAIYAIMLVSIFGDIASAFQFSEMSLELNEKFNNARLRGTLLHLHGDHINFWRRHIATDLPILDRAFTACLEVGDLVYAGFLAFETVWQLIEKGDALDDVVAQSARYAAFTQQSHNDAVYETIRLEQQFMASLAGRNPDPLSFTDGSFDEAACLCRDRQGDLRLRHRLLPHHETDTGLSLWPARARLWTRRPQQSPCSVRRWVCRSRRPIISTMRSR